MASRRGGRRGLHGGRVLILLAVLGTLYLASLFVRIAVDGRRDDRAPADVIIVLGAAQYDGRPTPVYQARLDHALALYHAGYAPYVLFTGGKRPADRFTEAEAGQRYALAHDVPSSAIFLENEGRTTWQSLQAASAIMQREGLRSSVLVSDPFHAFRLRRMARDLNLRARVSPAEHSRIRSLPVQGRYILREVGVYAAYRLFGI